MKGSDNRIVILGSKGFVAASLARYLNALNKEVIALSSKDIDLTHSDSFSKLSEVILPTDKVIITSTLTPDKGKDVNTLMSNLVMGQNLANFFKSNTCSFLIYISSDAVYADNAHPVRESSNTNPASFHGTMHFVREKILIDTCKSKALPLLILRPTAIYGRGDTHLSYGPNKFIKSAIDDGIISFFGKGEEKRDHLYIEDLSRLVSLCLERRVEGVLNVASGTSISFHEVGELVREHLGRDIEFKYSSRSSEIIHRHFDNSYLLSLFPDFCYTNPSDGIKKSLGD